MHRTRFSPAAIAGVGALATAALTAPSLADIQLSVTAGPTNPQPGEVLDLKITVTNDGPFDRSDVSVFLDFPAGLSGLSDSLHDGDCPSTACEPGETALYSIPDLPAGEGRVYFVPVVVAGGTAPGTMIPFDVQAFDNGDLETTATTSVIVEGNRDLNLVVTTDRDPVSPGDRQRWTLTYGVETDSAGAIGAELSLPLPAGASFEDASGGGSVVDGAVVWDLGNIGPGSVGERWVDVIIDGGATTGTITATTATFSAAGELVSFERATRVEDEPPLELTITANPDPVAPGEIMDVELTITNTGAFDRNDVFIRLEYPGLVAGLSDSLYEGDCPSTACEERERSFFDVGTLAPGKGITYSLPIQMSGSALPGRVLSFQAEGRDSMGSWRRAASNAAVIDARPSNLRIAEDRDPVAPGDVVTYTLAYGVNEDAGGGVGATLEATVPVGLDFVSADGGATVDGDIVTWSLGNLDPGSTGERRLVLTPSAGVPLGRAPMLEVRYDDQTGNERSTLVQDTTRVQAELPLQLSISATPSPARPGEVLDVDVLVSNAGAFDRTGVFVRLEYGAGLAGLSDSFYAGDCPSTACEPRETVVFNVGTLAPGEGRRFQMPIQVASGTGDGFVVALEGRVDDAQGDRIETAVPIAVDGTRSLELALVEVDDPIDGAAEVAYTATYGTIPGGPPVLAGELVVILPEHVTFSFATDGGVFSGDRVTWDVGALDPGDGGARRVHAIVTGDAPDGTQPLARATFVDAADADGIPVRATERTRAQSGAPLDVELTLDRNTAGPGEDFNVNLRVTNTTGFDRTGVVLLVEFPDGIGSVPDGDFPGDCPSTGCEARESAFISIGTLAAGETVTFSGVVPVGGSTPIGTVMRWDAQISDDQGANAADHDSLKVGSVFDAPGKGDTGGDLVVNLEDLLTVLSQWGECDDPDACEGDFDGDGGVGIGDLLTVLANWS